MVNLDSLDDKITDDESVIGLTKKGLELYGEGKSIQEEIKSNYIRKVLYFIGGAVGAAMCINSTMDFIMDKDSNYTISYILITAGLTIYSGIEAVKSSNKVIKKTEELSALESNPEYKKTEEILCQYDL
jgi:hypothetical protein